MYGQRCKDTCGKCKANAEYNVTTGYCPGECEPGWQGNLCKDCAPYGNYKIPQFGDMCQYRCRCVNEEQCDRDTGHCANGCAHGWMGPGCQYRCTEGKYGYDCNETCGHCKDNEYCDVFNGYCPGDCNPGWQGALCKEECNEHSFGVRCNSSCGNCLNSVSCDKVTGHCLSCAAGFMGNFCIDECPDGFYGNCMMKCGTCKDADPCDKARGYCPYGCEHGYRSPQCTEFMTVRDLFPLASATASSHIHSYDASRAIDGVNSFQADICECCLQTSGLEVPWLLIDLGNSFYISQIQVTGRSDGYSEQYKNIRVYISEMPFNDRNSGVLVYVASDTETSFRFNREFEPGQRLRYIMVRRLEIGIMTICEVYVLKSEIYNANDKSSTGLSKAALTGATVVGCVLFLVCTIVAVMLGRRFHKRRNWQTSTYDKPDMQLTPTEYETITNINTEEQGHAYANDVV